MSSVNTNLLTEVRHLLSNSSWVFGVNVYKFGLSFVRSIVLARLLGAEKFGEFSIVIATVGLIYELFSLNLPTTLTKFGSKYVINKNFDKFNVLLNTVLLLTTLSGIVSAITFVALFKFNILLESTTIPQAYIYIYFTTFIGQYYSTIFISGLRLFNKFKQSSILYAIFSTVEIAMLSISLLFFPGDLIFFILVISFISIVSSVFLIKKSLKMLSVEGVTISLVENISLCWNEARNIFPFSINNSFSRTIKTIIDKGDLVFLSMYVSNSDIGIYVIAKKLSMIVFYAIDPVVTSVFPQFSKLLAENKKQLVIQLVRKSSLFVFLGMSVYLLVSWFIADWFILVSFGPTYTRVGELLQVFNVSIFFNAILFWHLPVTWSLGASNKRLIVYGFFFVVTLLLVVPAVQMYSMIGVVWLHSIIKSGMAIVLSIWVLMPMIVSKSK